MSVGSAFACSFACALAIACASTSAGAADGPIRWRLPTEVLGAGDAFTPAILGDAYFSPGGTTSLTGPNFGERMAVTHLPTTDETVGDVIVAASLSGMSIRRTRSGAFEPYPDCDPLTGASRPTGAIALLRLPSGGLRYELETIIVPGAEEMDITTWEDCGPGCIAGTRLALSGRSMAAISGAANQKAEARPAASRLRVHRRTDAGVWVEEPVRIVDPGTWINAYDVDFVDEDTLVAIAAEQQLSAELDVPPREVHVFERVAAPGGGFEWASSARYPDFAFSAHELGVGSARGSQPGGTGEWPRIDAMPVGADDPTDGAGIRIAVGAPGFSLLDSSGGLETRGAVYRVHLPDLGVQPKGVAAKSRIGEGENDPSEAPKDRRVGHSIAIDAERIYFSAIGSSAVQSKPNPAADAIVAVAHADESAWQANDDAGDGRVIITASMLPSPAPGVLPWPVGQRLGIGFGRDIAVQNGGLVVRSEQYAYGISGGPVLAQRFEPVSGQTTWRRTDVYETGRPMADETYGLSYGSLAVSETGLVLLGDPALGGGLTQDPGAAWIFSDTSDSNGDGAPDAGDAEGVELVVIDEWSIDLSTAGPGSSTQISRAIGISEQLRHAYPGGAVRVTCVRTAHFDVAMQPAVMEYSSAMLSSHGYAHIVGNREISVASATLPVPNCLRTGIGGYRPAHEAELLRDIVARWPWRAKNRVVLALAHDCDQDAIPNLAIAAESSDVVTAIAFAAGGTDEHRSNLLAFLRAVDRAKTLTFPDDYDQQLVDGSTGSCAVLPFIRPSLFSNGAFDPTLGYPRSGFEQASLWPDFDGDGGIGAVDIAGLLDSWGTSSGDLSGDGLTGAQDLAAVLAMWGELPAAPLPCPNEP